MSRRWSHIGRRAALFFLAAFATCWGPGCGANSDARYTSMTASPRTQENASVSPGQGRDRGELYFRLEKWAGPNWGFVRTEISAYANVTVCERRVATIGMYVPQFQFARGSANLQKAIYVERGGKGQEAMSSFDRRIGRLIERHGWNPEKMVIHGFVWPGEVESRERAQELSRRRTEAVREWLQRAGLPAEAMQAEAHGLSRTNMPSKHRENPVEASLQTSADDPVPRSEQVVGPPLSRSHRDAFLRFVGNSESRSSGLHSPTIIEVEYREPREGADGSTEDFSTYKTSVHGHERPTRLSFWSRKLFEQGCNGADIEPPGQLSDSALE